MKVWLITGAARGFGGLIAQEALANGDAVVATARNAQAITDRIGSHENLPSLALDVTNEDQARTVAQKAVERFGRIDVLLNNAGFGLLGAIEEASPEEIERIYATNVFGLLKVTRAVLPHMRKQKSGRILNVSSVGGYCLLPGWGIYCSSKFAVEGLSEALSQELAPFNVKVTIIEPRAFPTHFLYGSSLAVTSHVIKDYDGTPAGDMRGFAPGYNHQQRGDPAKLAKAMIKLANSDNPPLRMPFGDS